MQCVTPVSQLITFFQTDIPVI